MATNADAPFGLEVITYGQPLETRRALVLGDDSAVLGVNDPIVITTLSSGKLVVTRATAGSGIDGTVINPRYTGWQYTDTNLLRPASTLTEVIVLIDKAHAYTFRVQTASGTNFSAGLANKFCDLDTVGNASSTLGVSTVEVDVSTAHSTDGDVFVYGLDDTYGGVNEAGQEHAKVFVRISNT